MSLVIPSNTASTAIPSPSTPASAAPTPEDTRDALLEAAQAEADFLAFYYPVASASVENGDTVMTDLGGSEPDLILTSGAGSGWLTEDAGPDGMQCVKIPASASSKYAALGSQFNGSAEALSGFLLFQTVDVSNASGWRPAASFGGTTGTPSVANQLVLFMDNIYYGVNKAGGSGQAQIAHAGDTGNRSWVFWFWRWDGSAIRHYLCAAIEPRDESDGGWIAGGSPLVGSNLWTTTKPVMDSLMLGYYGLTAASTRVSCIGLFSSDIDVTGFKAIMSAYIGARDA